MTTTTVFRTLLPDDSIWETQSLRAMLNILRHDKRCESWLAHNSKLPLHRALVGIYRADAAAIVDDFSEAELVFVFDYAYTIVNG